MNKIAIAKIALSAIVVMSIIYLAYEEFEDHPKIIGAGAASAVALLALNAKFLYFGRPENV